MDVSLRSTLLVAAALVLGGGCHAIFGLTDYDVGTASGGATGTTSGTGGGAGGCSEPADCPGQDSTCSFRTCDAGQCGVTSAPQGTPCIEDGGRVCDDAGNCVECNQPADCGSDEDCVDHRCVSSACSNGAQDGDETDVDCGGSCPACSDGQRCSSYEDCASGFCEPSGGGGAGGGAAGRCAACAADADCDARPDSFCDGATGDCTDDLAGGASCDRDAQCSGVCSPAEQVCCDTACDGTCQSCLASQTGGTDGTCATTTACASCDAQYGSDAAVHELCDANATDCVLRLSIQTVSCAQICQGLGGECLSAVNDEPNATCGAGTELVACGQVGYTSVLCTCSNGCGNGPPCTGGEVCTSGVCG